MIPLPTYPTIAQFASAGTQTTPGGSQGSTAYTGGFIPGDLFPAEWANWLFGQSTLQLNNFETTINSMNNELLSILSAASISANVGVNDQVIQSIYKQFSQRGIGVTNLGLAASVASSALTIALKQIDGSTDPASGTGQVFINFRSATLSSGAIQRIAVSGALSTVISSGSTAGFTNAVPGYLYIYAILNSTTVELAWSGTDCWDEGVLQTTTAEGGAGAADSGTTLYSTTARSNVPIRFIGVMKATEATAGTWATAPSQISVAPCDRNQQPVRNSTLRSAATSITSATPKTFAQITLPAGTWDLRGHGGVQGAGATALLQLELSISLTTNTSSGNDTFGVPSIAGEYRNKLITATGGSADLAMDISPYRITITSSTTFFLVITTVFTTSTATAYGEIEATFIHR